MNIIIVIIVTCQIFCAGMYFQDKFMWRDGFKDGLKISTITLLIICFGVVLVIIAIPIYICGFVYHRIINKLHLPFLVKYVWLKRPLPYHDVEEKKRIIHHEAKKKKAKLSWWMFGDKIYIWIDKWIIRTYPYKA